MSREKIDKPHRTPHPDAPHLSGPARDPGPDGTPAPSPPDDAGGDEPNYDSCFDDLNRELSDSHHEPDPILESSGTSQAPRPTAPAQPAPPGGSSPAGKPPRTSEVFRAAGVAAAEPTGEPSPRSGRSGRATVSPSAVAIQPAAAPREATRSEGMRKSREQPGSDDDALAEAGIPWFSLLLLTYSSIVTLALTWLFWSGRLFKTAEAPPPASSQPAVEPVTKAPEPIKSPAQLPPIPPENVTDLGGTIRIGELEVTPIAIVLAPVDLVRAIDSGDWRREEGDSLVLRLRLTNVSKDQVFAPLERAFVRDQSSPLDRSLIAGLGGQSIGLFPLANDSEWSIQGQEFPTLKPAESTETIIATEPEAAGRVAGEMVWRVRLRIGAYRTDMVGVRFHPEDMSR
jgi:hypothetical protein